MTKRSKMDSQLSWLEHPLDVRKVIGSSPISSTIYEKSELLHDRKCVRVFCLYQRHYILMLRPGGFHRPLGFFVLLIDATSIFFIRCIVFRTVSVDRSASKSHHCRAQSLPIPIPAQCGFWVDGKFDGPKASYIHTSHPINVKSTTSNEMNNFNTTFLCKY